MSAAVFCSLSGVMSLRSSVTLVAGTVGGLAASALALQATGRWRPTKTQAAAVVAVASATASVASIRGAVDRFRTDIRWRRARFVAVSIVIALASVAATAADRRFLIGVEELGSPILPKIILYEPGLTRPWAPTQRACFMDSYGKVNR